MVATVVGTILVISLFITIYLGVFTLFFCESTKKNYFILLITAVFLFVLGYLLEVTANTTDGALTATKVMYLGSAFISPLYLLFTADYCEVNIKKVYIIVPLVLVPAFVNILIWFVPFNHLVYSAYEYLPASVVPHLEIEPGTLYYLNHAFAAICMVASISMVINRIIKWDKKFKFQLILVLVGALSPLIANLLYVLRLNLYEINYTPVSLVIFNSVFYVAIMRYDLFNLLPKASAMALSSIKEAFILIDTQMNFLNANPSAYSVFPELSNLRKGSSMSTLSTWPKEMEKLDTTLQSREISFSQYNGENKFYNTSVNPVIVKKRVVGWVLLIQDVTSAHLLHLELKKHATFDVLTGIYNRRHFMEIVRTQIVKARRENTTCYIVMLDIDYFKEVNDTYGHQAGDCALSSLASIVKNTIRSYDIFARYGGEEFILFIEGDRETVSTLTERIRLAIAENKIVHGDNVISMTASLGAAIVEEWMNAEEVVQSAVENADIALYKAKESGRNRVVFFEDML